MDIHEPLIFSATAKLGIFDTTLFKTTTLSPFLSNEELHIEVNNTTSLAVIYNEAIDMALMRHSDCLILVHDDVILEEDPIPKLETLFDTYDLVGVAGCSTAKIQSPALWHIMGGGFNSGNLHGKVQHGSGDSPLMSNFGPVPHRVVMIDGVFMALSRKMMESGVRFDENNPADFHFYDLNFSMDAHIAGFKVGVGDILITHESPGLLTYTDGWVEGEKYFINRHGN